MLETVKRCIESPCISFGRYFCQYVLKIHDMNIDNEVAFLLRNNSIDVNTFNRVMNMEADSFDKL